MWLLHRHTLSGFLFVSLPQPGLLPIQSTFNQQKNLSKVYLIMSFPCSYPAVDICLISSSNYNGDSCCCWFIFHCFREAVWLISFLVWKNPPLSNSWWKSTVTSPCGSWKAQMHFLSQNFGQPEFWAYGLGLAKLMLSLGIFKSGVDDGKK